MSVSVRVEDALLLWERGRREGAFLTALIAVAATFRKRFPDRKMLGDREAFEAFLKSALSVLGVCREVPLHEVGRRGRGGVPHGRAPFLAPRDAEEASFAHEAGHPLPANGDLVVIGRLGVDLGSAVEFMRVRVDLRYRLAERGVRDRAR